MPDPDDGFAELWDAHYDGVLSYAARRVDHETARDVAAETFLIAWRRRDDIPADRPFPWLLNGEVLAEQADAATHSSKRRCSIRRRGRTCPFRPKAASGPRAQLRFAK